MSRRYAHGSTLQSRQLASSEVKRALTAPPSSLPTKSQFLRLWRALHSRNYAQSPDMRSSPTAGTRVGPFSAGERCALA
jgi:hypothetical protein